MVSPIVQAQQTSTVKNKNNSKIQHVKQKPPIASIPDSGFLQAQATLAPRSDMGLSHSLRDLGSLFFVHLQT